ncbi:PLC-like phosphodiesterase [Lentinus tigrinus ALCF2SS1-7]|uniref:PLC-like phosphodiesterase n=1 Tax=Lentinus tigrinus ALCF2SS1-6 TaxID=1328759 RepID=A0A5C2SUS9_9APHY|nr:PLC-like phosphodiesterase [Lentinus tigrinus ALCF2SS1-6]RPD80813.1 PLC-like phosphodiesterase [Lentinus tigrinus ALCF2SS1-7]
MSAMPISVTSKAMPECWGHRGASASFPENTLASFEAAIRDGAEGIESDVHVSVDDVVIMFHDPSVDRVTDGSGLIREKLWYGEGGMQELRTVKEPKQSLATFEETVQLLMKPENRHVKFNVDVKVQNKPAHLFALMHKVISAQPEWETTLAPRILLGLWHPSFLPHAKTHLPYCRRSYIGQDIAVARKYFWDSCDVFSIKFSTLAMADGAKFRKDCKAAGKKVMAWTVNNPEHMVEAVRWGIDVIITDVTKTWLDLRGALQVDYDKIAAQYSRMFYWTTLEFYTPMQIYQRRKDHSYLEGYAGPFRKMDMVEPLPLVASS